MGPIQAGQNFVRSLAYSPSGDRIASGGSNKTICIWDSNTGELLVGPIKGLGSWVESIVWSSDSSKLYSASDKFARVFDSVSGTELNRFEHNNYVHSVALSPKHNVLACVGLGWIAQLWDTESYQPLGNPFSPEDSVELGCVSFSRDGRYLAYGGDDKKITLWTVKDIAPELPVCTSIGIHQGNNLHSRKFNLSPHHLSLKSVLSHSTSTFSCSPVLHRLMPQTLLRDPEVMT